MTVYLSYFSGAGAQFFNDNGVTLSGGLLYIYLAGTTTPTATYTTSTGNVANSNPILLDAAGRTPDEIWLTSGTNYKFVLKTSAGVTLGTYDDIPGVNDPTAVSASILSQLANTSDAAKGDALIGFKQANPFSTTSLLTGAVARTVHQKFTEMVSLRDFGAKGDGSSDDTSAFQAAINACANGNITLFVPDGVFMYSNVTVPAGKALSIQGSSNQNAILKQISPYSPSTAGITSTGPLYLNNVGINQNWLSSVQPTIAGYNDGADPNTWGGCWVIDVNTTGQVEIKNCYFTNICRGVVISNATYVDFFNNYSDSTASIAQSICATSSCQQVSMNQNTLISTRWTTNQGNGGSGMFNFNATNLELCNNTTVGHQWVGRGSPATFTASISGTTMTVSAVASGALAVGQTFSGTNVLSDNTIVSQTSGTPGGVGVYEVAFSNTGASGTFSSYMARLVVADNIIDTPVADTAFYGYKNAAISGNVVRMSGDMGITIDGSQYVSIVGNSINGTRIGGINVSNAYSVVVSDNNIKDIGQGSQGPYAIIDQYGRFASNGGQWLSAITVNFLVNVPPSKGIVISNNSMWFENPPPVSDIYGPVAAIVKGIYIESTTNPSLFGINTCSITGNFVESIYSTVPQFFVFAFDHRFYSMSGTGTPIEGELFTDGSGNSFVYHSLPSGFNGFTYLKKMVGTVGNGVTFTGALSGATIVSESAGGGAALIYVGVTGAGNNDWTTTYANMNLGV